MRTNLGTLRDWPGHWIIARCGCTATYLAVSYLTTKRRIAIDTPIAELVRRLRCQRCGNRPRDAILTDNPRHHATDMGPRTVIDLMAPERKTPGAE